MPAQSNPPTQPTPDVRRLLARIRGERVADRVARFEDGLERYFNPSTPRPVPARLQPGR